MEVGKIFFFFKRKLCQSHATSRVMYTSNSGLEDCLENLFSAAVLQNQIESASNVDVDENYFCNYILFCFLNNSVTHL